MYRKFKADQIFTGHELITGNTVLITDEKGVVKDLLDISDAGEGIEVLEGLLVPGFINCHCHLELSHMKGRIPKGTGLVDFVLKVVNERDADAHNILNAIAAAEQEMIDSGIVAVGDICNNDLTLTQKSKGNLYYHNFIEATGFVPATAAQRFQRSHELYETFGRDRASASLVPHAPYSVSPELFARINELTGNRLLTIHNQEIPGENELFENGRGDFFRMYDAMGIITDFFKPSGRSSLQTWLPYINREQSLILVHNVSTSEQDIDFALERAALNKLDVHFCLCANANLYISKLLPDVQALRKMQAAIVLGTDSLASNDQLSILEEMRTLSGHFPGLPKEELLGWATINGARALGIDNVFGSFDKGKRPGLVNIDTGFSKAKKIM